MTLSKLQPCLLNKPLRTQEKLLCIEMQSLSVFISVINVADFC